MRSILAPLALASSLAVTLACQPGDGGTSAASPESREVVAVIGGKNITLGELEVRMKEDLFKQAIDGKAPGEIWELRMQTIDALADETLLEQAAAKASKKPEELLAEMVAALGSVSDAEVRDFFVKNQGRLGAGASEEQLAPRIREYLASQRPIQVKETLRKDGLVTKLEPPRSTVEAIGPALGPADAPVTMIEFSDYQCPFCQRAEPIVKELIARYPGKLRLVYRHMPLEGMHPRARPAAAAAVCADEQGKFWEFHYKLFENQQALQDPDLEGYAKDVGIELEKWKECRARPETEKKISVDLEAARAAGLTGTPAFFINGILVSGARPVEDFARWIDKELAPK